MMATQEKPDENVSLALTTCYAGKIIVVVATLWLYISEKACFFSLGVNKKDE